MEGTSDFDDDEDFGLGAPIAQGTHTQKQDALPEEALQESMQADKANDDEEDIYGDIAEHSAAERAALPPVEGDTTPAGSTLGAEQQASVIERQNSGQLAETRASESAAIKVPDAVRRPGSKAQLPKRLADTTVIYVGELQWWTTDAELESLCLEFGVVSDITFFEEKATGKSKGYALVEFTNKEAANLCRQQMHGTEINGRKCVVTFSSNSSAATAAAKAGGRQESRPAPPSGAAPAPPKGPPPQGRGWSGRGGWGMAGMPMPPLPPWPGGPVMGMGHFPMPGMGMPPFMGMRDQRGPGDDSRDFKRKRF